MFHAILAIDENGGVGKDNTIPWHCPEDMKHFKIITSGNVVIMGRLTWESLPEKVRPLPNRFNVVISTKNLYDSKYKSYPDVVFKSIDETLMYFSKNKKQYQNVKLYVMGGASIYQQFFDRKLIADVHITMINKNYICDKFVTIPELFKLSETPLSKDVIYYHCSTINSEEYQYLHLMHDIINDGNFKENRTGVPTVSLFSRELRFDLSQGKIPMMTTRPISLRYVFEELMWILRGQTDNKVLNKKKIHIWDDNTTREFLDKRNLNNLPKGDVGASYGFQMRHYGETYVNCNTEYNGFDQLQYVINLLNNDPNSRRIIINLWNPAQLDKMALPPCVYGYQFYVNNERLSCKLLQRSSDICLAGSHNCVAGALLVNMICAVTDYKPGELIWSPSDIHIYINQVDAVAEQLNRIPAPFPILKIVNRPLFGNIRNFEFKDFVLLNYKPQPKINFAMNA